MFAILRQVRANQRSRRLQSGLILITLTAAATMLAFVLSSLNTTQNAYDRLFERTNGSHLKLFLNPTLVSAQQIEHALDGLPGIESRTEVVQNVRTNMVVDGVRLTGEELSEWPADNIVTARPILMQGRAPLPGETDVIVLDRNMAYQYEIKVGDTVEVLTPGGLVPLTVIGLALSAEKCPYGNCNPVPHYLADGALAGLGLYGPDGYQQFAYIVGLRLEDPSKLGDTLKAIINALPSNAILLYSSWLETRAISDDSIDIPRIIIFIFCVVAGLSAGFLIVNTITETVLAQTRQIGLLKAVGFTRLQLGLTYLAEYIGLALLASVIGSVLGVPLAMITLRELAAKFGEPMLKPSLELLLVIPLVMAALSAISVIWPVRRAVRLDTVTAIRLGQERLRRKGARLPKLPLSVAVGIGDALAHPRRSALTALGLVLAIFAMTTALSIRATADAFFTDPAYGIHRDGDLFVTRSAYITDAQAMQLIDEQPEIADDYGIAWQVFRFPDDDRIYFGRFFDGDFAEFENGVFEGRMLQAANEAVVGYKLSVKRNLKVGDSLEILIAGESTIVTVVGIYRELNNQGLMAIFSLDMLHTILPDAVPYNYVLRLAPGADLDAVQAALIEASNDQLDITSNTGTTLDSEAIATRQMVTWLAVVLTALTTLGVFNTVWMGIQERRRELAIFKAVGMTPGQVMQSVITNIGAIAVVSYIIGLPLGVFAISKLTNAVARTMDFGPLVASMNIPGLVLMFPAVILIAILGALVPARRAARMNTVAALQYE